VISNEDIEAFEYYNAGEEDKVKTPLEMVREYHDVAGLDLDFKLPVSLVEIKEKADKNPEWGNKAVELGNLRHDLVEEEVDELFEAQTTEDLLKEMADVVYVVYGMAATFGLDLDEALKRVHENNMGRMYQPDGTIKRREDGKILKNPNTPKVDLSDLV